MTQRAQPGAPGRLTMIDPRVMDPDGVLSGHADIDATEMDQIVAVLQAMNDWRDLERALSEQARAYMQLGDTDMRALRYLIAAQRQDVVVTPGMIASHLGISPAAATKLTDRLASGGHIRRSAHPADRRRLAIEVTEETAASARASVGRSHARRFDAIAAMSHADRAAVLRFFEGLTASAETMLVAPE